MKVIFSIAILALALSFASAKVFTKCELARELYNLGKSMASLPDWVCLVESESSFNTAAVGGPNSNGSRDWGLFQINDGYWCLVGSVGNDCNANCYNFTDDNIADDVKCADLIYSRHGFSAWYGWQSKCQGSLPSVSECF